MELDFARPGVFLAFGLDAEVAEQAGQQGAVNFLVAGRGLVRAQADLDHLGVELAVDFAPLAQARGGEEMLAAQVEQLAVGFLVLQHLVVERPQLDVGDEVGVVVLELAVLVVRRLLAVHRPVARVLHRQGGGDDQHFGQAVFRLGRQDHAADARVDRELGKLAAGFGQRVLRVHRAEFLQQLEAVGDGAGIGRFEEGEVLDLAQAQRLHPQNHGGQVAAADFRVGEGGAGVEILLRVQPDAHAAHHPAAAAGALVGGGLGDFLDLQALHLGAVAVAQQAGVAGVDDVADAGHGERGFRHVGGEHDAARPAGLEHALLLGGGKAGEQRQDFAAGGVVLAQRFGGVADFALAGEEDQDVAGAGARDLVHRVEDGFLDIRLADFFLRFPVLALALVQRAVAHFHRVQPAGYFDHRGAVEVLGKPLRVDGGRGDDDFQVGPPGQDLLQVAEQEVDVEAALVRLVDDDRVVGAKEAVVLGFRQQDAVGHQLDVAVRAGMVGKAHLVADDLAERALQFLRDARGHGAGGDAARLGVADQAGDAAPEFQADFRQLGGLARAGFAADDDHLVGGDGGGDILAPARDRQLFGVGGDGQALQSLLQQSGRARHGAFQLLQRAVRRLAGGGQGAQLVELAPESVAVCDHAIGKRGGESSECLLHGGLRVSGRSGNYTRCASRETA